MSPSSRDDFHIAIICALTLEADAVEALFDETYDRLSQRYGKDPADKNAYINGKLGRHDVVLCYLPGMGKRNAAAVAANLQVSYRNIKLALLVGICGGVPFLTDKTEVILGDVFISDSVVEYDFGRQYPDGFRQKSDVKDILGRPSLEIRAFIAALNGRSTRKEFEERTRQHLAILQTQRGMGWEYPGTGNDVLFEPSFRHRHYISELHHRCVCFSSSCDSDPICEEALAGDCDTLGCVGTKVHRDRLSFEGPNPAINVGKFASADTVMKSGKHRQEIANKQDVVAFEMEAAGLWDILPCVIIKGVCDYADSHKNKKWQGYAAGTAACCTKSFLEYWVADSRQNGLTENPTISVLASALRTYYTTPPRLMVQRISGEPVPMHQCYINMGLVQGIKPVEGDTGGQSLPLSLLPRLKVEAMEEGDEVNLPDLFEPRSNSGRAISPSRILIQGRAGVGKTTLCKKMVHDYLYQGMWSTLFRVILWIPLRNLKGSSSANRTLDRVFHEVFFSDVPKGKVLAEKLQDIVFNPSDNQNVLFILDGLDEVSQEWEVGTPEYNLLLRLLNSPWVIVTSRPYGMYLTHWSFDLELEVIGFTPRQVDAYVKKTLSYDTERASRILQFVEAQSILQGLSRIPIQLDALCYPWNQSFVSHEPTTMTELYERLTLKLWQKDVTRLLGPETRRGLNEGAIRSLSASQIDDLIPYEIDLVQRMAFTCISNGIVDLNARHRQQIYDALNSHRVSLPSIPEAVLRNVSFLHSSDRTLIDCDRSYHFLHLTFQEYFAARYFVRCWTQQQGLLCVHLAQRSYSTSLTAPQSFLQTNKYNPRFEVMWRFAAGLFTSYAAARDNGTELQAYFDQLDIEPRDILGPAHQRLMMVLLNEVSLDEPVSWGRDQIAARIFNWMSFSLVHTERYFVWNLIKDYPTYLLERFVEDGANLRARGFAIEELLERGAFSVEFVSRLCSLSPNRISIGNTPSNSTDRESLMISVFEALILLLEAKILSNHHISLLWLNSANFQHLSKPLLDHLQGDNNKTREMLIESLWRCKRLPLSIVKGLLSFLQHPSSTTRLVVIDILSRQDALPREVMVSCVDLLNDEDASVRSATIRLLGRLDSSSAETLRKILLSLDDECKDVRLTTVRVVIQHCSSNTQALSRCLGKEGVITAKVLDEVIKWPITLTPGALRGLCSLVHHELERIRFLANMLFLAQRSIPLDILEAIVPALHDSSPRIAFTSALVMSREQSLPAVCAAALQQNQSTRLYYDTLVINEKVPLSKQELVPIISFLKTKDFSPIQDEVIPILHKRPGLQPEAVDSVMELVVDPKYRFLGVSLLFGQLSPQAIDILLKVLATENKWSPWHIINRITEILNVQQALPPQSSNRILSFIVSRFENYVVGDVVDCLLEIVHRQPDRPPAEFNTIFQLVGKSTCLDMPVKYERFVRKHGKINCDLAPENWGHLYRIWLYRGFPDPVSCCFVDNCLVLDTPEGTLRVEFDKAKLRAVKHEIRKMQIALGVPEDTVLSETWGDWAKVRLTGRNVLTRLVSR
ncbi:hypothetical protein BJX64DRAFT_283926 [Aspergillus heterothallicus]